MKIILLIVVIALASCSTPERSSTSWTERVEPVPVLPDGPSCDNAATRKALGELQQAQRNYNEMAVLPPEQRKGVVGKSLLLSAAKAGFDKAIAACNSGPGGA